jgi:hypothetical protein
MPANWFLPHVRGDWLYLTEMLVATAVGVFGYTADSPVVLRTFAAENPCPDCSWGDQA